MPPYGVRFVSEKRATIVRPQGSLVERELARERLRDCKRLEFAEQKRKR